jgi:glycosyltransferase involved in cell wall biosynthesis
MSAGDLPSASVVVAACNAEATIDECLRSLTRLRYPRERLELVVVDNGSRDRTCNAVERYADDVTLLHEPRRGPAAARNAGIRASHGDVIALTDADCTVDENWLDALVQPLTHPSVGIAGGTILARRPATAIELFGESIHDHRRAILAWRPPYVITMNWAARRELVDEVGPFDETIRRGSDVDYSYRVGRAGYKLAFCPEAIVYHRNERSLVGLAREGWTHGFHGVAIRRRYAAYIADAHRSPAADLPPPGQADRASFHRAFDFGKGAGSRAGALREFLRRQ